METCCRVVTMLITTYLVWKVDRSPLDTFVLFALLALGWVCIFVQS